MKVTLLNAQKVKFRYNLNTEDCAALGVGGTRRQDPIAHAVSRVVKDVLLRSPYDKEKLGSSGVFVGCSIGGLASLREAFKGIDSKISHHFVKDWFPATIQGVISIQNGFRGLSKTFANQEFSDLAALWGASTYLNAGMINHCLVVSCSQAVVNNDESEIQVVLLEIAQSNQQFCINEAVFPLIDIKLEQANADVTIKGPWIEYADVDELVLWRGGELLGEVVCEKELLGGRLPLRCGIGRHGIWRLGYE